MFLTLWNYIYLFVPIDHLFIYLFGKHLLDT